MTARMPRPDGLLRIGAVARRSGLSVDTIRYYEERGLIEAPRRSRGGYRLFEPSVADRLRLIRRGRTLGMSLSELGEILELADSGEVPCGQARDTLRRRLGMVDSRIADLVSLRRRLTAALQEAETRPEDGCICPVIEGRAIRSTDGERAGRGSRGPSEPRKEESP